MAVGVNVPGPWETAVLALAAYRVWRLIADDTILDRPRAWVLGVPGWKPTGHETPPDGYREKLATLLTCPWCMGFHLAYGVFLFWLWLPTPTLLICVPLAISSAVGLIAHFTD